MAGRSAAEVARRLRATAERQLRAAEQWEKGAEGERSTAEALAALPADSWTVMHDVAWPGRPRANIDHVVVGPGGVFVIDSKNWAGRVEVRDHQLRQDGRRRESVVASAAEAALAVTPMVAGTTAQPVVPVLCFVREERIAGWARDVMVCSTPNVAHMLTSRLTVLTPQQVAEAVLTLEVGLQQAAATTEPGRARRGVRSSAGADPEPDVSRPAPVRREPTGTSRRRRTRGTSPAHAVVGLLLAAVVLVPPAREATLGLLSDFIVSTARDGQAPSTTDVEADRTPAQERQQRRQERRRQRDAPNARP